MQKDKAIRVYYNNTKDFIRVYQAYSATIGNSALKEKTFVSLPFKMTRMTWIKPSFFMDVIQWMLGFQRQESKDYLSH